MAGRQESTETPRWSHLLREVVLTDCHQRVLENLEHNVRLNLGQGWQVEGEGPLVIRWGGGR